MSCTSAGTTGSTPGTWWIGPLPTSSVDTCGTNRGDPLYQLASSPRWWERRTAIVATFYFIRQGDLDDTFRLADMLADDPADLVQKAVGGWVREAGKRDRSASSATSISTPPRCRAPPSATPSSTCRPSCDATTSG